jgi:predicted ATPase
MGMQLNYTLQNIGNIDNASITIKPLTIIAGENSSGKTFVTKTLYTMLNSIYKNHFLNALTQVHQEIYIEKSFFDDTLNVPAKIDLEFNDKFEQFLDEGFSLIEKISTSNFNEEDRILEKNRDKFISFVNKAKTHFEGRLTRQRFQKHTEAIEDIINALDKFIYILNNRREIIINSIDSELKVGLKKNFQITNLKRLVQQSKDSSKLKLDDIGAIEIDKDDTLSFTFDATGIENIQNVKNIIFFDSPVYIKIRQALEKQDFQSTSKRLQEKYLKGYPEYIEELYDFIDKEYIDVADFDDISKDIQQKISGKLEVSKSGDINYTDNNNHTIPLSLTAMGISNVGLIDLLLRNNIINKGSFLIMDEPEVHLHPQWQVFLAQILYKIAKNGASIIIATHSLDFLKAFENILKDKHEKAEEVIAINKMPYDEEFTKLSELEKVGIVLDDLSRPFYDLYMADI